jgi:hypothetical protein
VNNITIDSDAVRDIVAKGIVQALGEEQRDAVLRQAVEHLIAVPKSSYGSPGKSPLQEAFDRAVTGAANTIVREMLNEDAVKAQVDAAIRAKVTAMLADGGGYLYETIGFAVGESVQKMIRGER